MGGSFLKTIFLIFKEVGDAKKAIDELDALMDTKGNYRNYRLAMKAVEPPVLPYLGVFLRDLLFIEGIFVCW